MSIFEIIMLLCFGASWPFSLYKTWVSKSSAGKSLVFLTLVLLGYLSGILHKILYLRDWVILLYLLNFSMVLTELILCVIYKNRDARSSGGASPAP